MDLYKKQCFLPWGQPWFECRSTQNIRLKKAKGRALHSKSKFLFRLCCWYYANCFWRFTPCSDVYCVCINVRIQPFGWRVYLWLWLNKMFPQVFLFWTLIFKINMEFPFISVGLSQALFADNDWPRVPCCSYSNGATYSAI